MKKVVNNYKYSVDDFTIETGDYDIPQLINCLCYVPGLNDPLNSEYEEQTIVYRAFEEWIQSITEYKTLKEYFDEEDLTTKYADLAVFINKKLGLKDTYQAPTDPFALPPAFDTILSSFHRVKTA